LNLKDARDAVSEKVYKFGATAALSFVKFKQDLGYAEGNISIIHIWKWSGGFYIEFRAFIYPKR
jgi:hypothetical protein